jgi:hypothetical protein
MCSLKVIVRRMQKQIEQDALMLRQLLIVLGER